MSLLHLHVSRYLPSPALGVTVIVQAELVNWTGVHLMLHRSYGLGPAADDWSCSHELTGYHLSTGATPEAALANAIGKLRSDVDAFRAQVSALPVINPIVIGK